MNPQIPEAFDGCVDLALDSLGGFVLYATDDFFAEKENLLKASAPVFIDDKYTDKGKWMDGWESQRRRTPGHDWAVIRLGLPGAIKGVIVDTTHFRGNAPAEIQLEGIDAGDGAPPLDDGYQVIIAKTPVKPHTPNQFILDDARRFTHLKLRIYPDGGVARLRVYGRVKPSERAFLRPGAIDLVAVENGGEVAKVSDRFFGPPSNLLLPGRGVNMGDGWETARRRTPGTDWAVLQLGRPGMIERIELDTHFFKGNAPQAVTIEAVDARELKDPFAAAAKWKTLLAKTPLEPHRRHVLYPDRQMIVTHARVHIHPHGGVNRLRMFGEPVDSQHVLAKLMAFNAASPEDAEKQLLAVNGSKAWVAEMSAARPFSNARALFATADAAWWRLSDADFLEAFAAHPKLGEKKPAPAQNAQSAAWSTGEQARLQGEATEKLATLNQQYVDKHGFIFILCASGRSAVEVLEAMEARIGNARAQEIENAALEQAKIARLRLEKWLGE